MPKVLALLGCVLFVVGISPCGPIPGGKLSGQTVEDAIEDWSFCDQFKRCQVEVRASDPHSVTASCFSADGDLYVGCMKCPSKRWSGYMSLDSEARVKLGDRIYAVRAERVLDPATVASLWGARWRKYEGGDPPAVPENYWLFQLRSR